MAAGAGDVRLQLGVTLDLAGFRQQLAAAARAAASFSYPINFDKRNLDRQFAAIDRQFKRRNYRLEVATNFAAEIKNADTLIGKIQQVKQAAQGASGSRGSSSVGLVNTAGLGLMPSRGGVGKNDIKALYESLAIAGVEGFERGTKKTRDKMIEQIGTVGQDTVAGLLNGLKSQDAALKAAAENLGMALITTFKAILGIASPSKVFKGFGDDVGKGFEQGALNAMDKAFDALENLARQRLRILDTIARGAFRMLGMDPAAMLAQERQRRLPPAINWPAQTPPPRPFTGPSSSGRLLTGAAAPLMLTGMRTAGLLPSTTQRTATARGVEAIIRNAIDGALSGGRGGELVDTKRIYAAIQKNLDEILRRTFAVIEVDVRETSATLKDALYSFSYLAQALRDAEARAKTARIDAAVDSLMRRIEETVRIAQARLRIVPAEVANLGAPTQRMLQGQRVAGLLPSIAQSSFEARGRYSLGGETRAAMFARRMQEARMRSALREADVMGGEGARAPSPYSYAYRSARSLSAIVPYTRGGALVPQFGGGGRPPGGGGGDAGFGLGPNFGRDLGRGLVGRGGGMLADIGAEFAEATKQVLLFGTAYKALAAVMALPGNIATAAASLQSFNNQLEAVTGGGQIMANSLSLIESTVKKFNMPIDSARQGFVRLYASMAPAGISGQTINSLFTGLAAASTTLGMSSDQVDRMTYALSQMASKGQISSEELKGQLGDVFPQAVSLFAEAAGFLNDTMNEQAKAKGLSSFLAALEDGALRGEAMQKVLANVGVLLNQDFGATGQKAANAFQGQINALNNALKSFYESFAPIAAGFLGEFVIPIVKYLTLVGDAVKLALSSDAIKGNPLASYLRDELFPQLQNIKAAIISAAQTFGVFAQAVAVVLRPLAQLIVGNQALVSSVARGLTIFVTFRTAVAALNALGLIPLIANIVRYNAVFRIFIAQTAAGASGSRAFSAVLATTGVSARQAVVGIRTLAATIRTALVTSAIGIAVVAIGLLIEKIMQLEAAANRIKAAKPGTVERLRRAGQTGGGQSLQQESRVVRAELQRKQRMANTLKTLSKGGTVSPAAVEELRSQGLDMGGLTFKTPSGQMAPQYTLQGGPGVETIGINPEIQRLAGQVQQELRGAQEGYKAGMALGGKDAAVVDRRLGQQAKLDFAGLGASMGGERDDNKERSSKAKQLAEQIAQQAQAASDALFSEQQRLLILQQTNPIAESIAKFTSQEATIQRELNAALKEAKSEKEKADRKQEASLKSSANVLELERAIKDVRTQALKPIEDLLASQREQLVYEADYKQLLKEGVNPEVAKQVAEVRKLVRTQLEVFDLAIKNAKTAITEAEARGASADAVAKLRKELTGLEEDRKKAEGRGKEAETGIAKAEGPKSAMDYLKDGAEAARKELEKLSNFGYQLTEAAGAIGNAFGTAFKQIITGSSSVQEAFANMFSSVADHFADMVAKMIAEWLKAQLIQGFMNIVGALIPGMGAAGGMLGAGAGGAAGFGGSFSSGIAPLPNVPNYASAFGARKFANGGIVTGPTMGLIGEGRYNEAVVPLPNGRSIPVELGGASAATNVIVNVDAKGTSVAGDQGAAQSLAKDLASVVDQRIIYHKRAGGLLSR
jgi:tape measure domain-containing protein